MLVVLLLSFHSFDAELLYPIIYNNWPFVLKEVFLVSREMTQMTNFSPKVIDLIAQFVGQQLSRCMKKGV